MDALQLDSLDSKNICRSYWYSKKCWQIKENKLINGAVLLFFYVKSVIFFDFPTFSWISLRNIFFYVNFLSEKKVKSKKIVLFLIKINRMISHIKSCFSPVFLDFRDSHYVAAVENDGGFNDLNNLVWKIVKSIYCFHGNGLM